MNICKLHHYTSSWQWNIQNKRKPARHCLNISQKSKHISLQGLKVWIYKKWPFCHLATVFALVSRSTRTSDDWPSWTYDLYNVSTASRLLFSQICPKMDKTVHHLASVMAEGTSSTLHRHNSCVFHHDVIRFSVFTLWCSCSPPGFPGRRRMGRINHGAGPTPPPMGGGGWGRLVRVKNLYSKNLQNKNNHLSVFCR